jgi:hypothetical protein
MNIFSFIRKFDFLFGKKDFLLYRKQESYKSITGGILTILYIITLLIILFIFLSNVGISKNSKEININSLNWNLEILGLNKNMAKETINHFGVVVSQCQSVLSLQNCTKVEGKNMNYFSHVNFTNQIEEISIRLDFCNNKENCTLSKDYESIFANLTLTYQESEYFNKTVNLNFPFLEYFDYKLNFEKRIQWSQSSFDSHLTYTNSNYVYRNNNFFSFFISKTDLILEKQRNENVEGKFTLLTCLFNIVYIFFRMIFHILTLFIHEFEKDFFQIIENEELRKPSKKLSSSHHKVNELSVIHFKYEMHKNEESQERKEDSGPLNNSSIILQTIIKKGEDKNSINQTINNSSLKHDFSNNMMLPNHRHGEFVIKEKRKKSSKKVVNELKYEKIDITLKEYIRNIFTKIWCCKCSKQDFEIKKKYLKFLSLETLALSALSVEKINFIHLEKLGKAILISENIESKGEVSHSILNRNILVNDEDNSIRVCRNNE